MDYFDRILRNVRTFREMQEREGHDRPRVSAWLTGLKETLPELPAFVRVAAEIGVKEVYLQRLVFFEEGAIGLARPDQALYEQMNRDESGYIEEAEALARSLGLTFSASRAASEPGMSLKRQDDDSPWALCRRPWTVMYFTANGRALPCCIAPFSQRGYENYTLGDATQDSLREIWNGPAYTSFARRCCRTNPRRPARAAGSGGTSEMARPSPEHAGRVSVAVVIPTLTEAGSIGRLIAEIPRHVVGRIIVADGGSTEGTIVEATDAETIRAGRGYGRPASREPRQRARPTSSPFMDGDGADDPGRIDDLVSPILVGTHDFVIGSRARGIREPGAMAWHQVASGLGAGWPFDCCTGPATRIWPPSGRSGATRSWRSGCAN